VCNYNVPIYGSEFVSVSLVWVWGKILDCGNGQTASGEDTEDARSLRTEHGTLMGDYVEGLSSCHSID